MKDFIVKESGQALAADPSMWCKPEIEIMDVHFPDPAAFKPEDIVSSDFSLWRYRRMLPFGPDNRVWQQVSMGEGATPLIPAGDQQPGLLLKMEYAMPTSSFKDRGAAVMLAKALEWGVKRVAADSSGNAGTSVAAYAAKAGIECDIFVPASTSEGKLAQMQAHGANIHRIDGPREASTVAVKEFIATERVFYASHVYNPYFHQGTKTMAYEIWEQMGFKAPDRLFLPVGNGTMYLGAYYGFRELHNLGLIENMPKLYGVQASPCAPCYDAFQSNKLNVTAVANTGTFAEGIAINNPPRGRQILEVTRATNGDILSITDEQTREAKDTLASMGYYVEPTAAISFAAASAFLGDNADGTTIAPLCGSGLKAPPKTA